MRIYGGVIVLWAIGLLAVLVPRGVWAQQGAVGDWEPLPLAEAVWGLHTSGNGAILAYTRSASEPTEGSTANVARTQFVRSDDGGARWRAFNLPPAAYLAAVDPTNGANLYAASEQGLHKSTDAGATWTL